MTLRATSLLVSEAGSAQRANVQPLTLDGRPAGAQRRPATGEREMRRRPTGDRRPPRCEHRAAPAADQRAPGLTEGCRVRFAVALLPRPSIAQVWNPLSLAGTSE